MHRKIYKTSEGCLLFMNATVVSFRRSRYHQKTNQLVLSLPKVDSKVKAEKLVGKSVVFKTQTKKEITGKITAAHGNSGCVRAIFERGIPGQGLGGGVEGENGKA